MTPHAHRTSGEWRDVHIKQIKEHADAAKRAREEAERSAPRDDKDGDS